MKRFSHVIQRMKAKSVYANMLSLNFLIFRCKLSVTVCTTITPFFKWCH